MKQGGRENAEQSAAMQKSSARKMAPRFMADDKFGDVVTALEAREWKRTTFADPTAKLRWRNLTNTAFDRVRPDTWVNHFRGTQNLSNKGKITRLLSALDEGRGASCFPRCHALGPQPACGSAKAVELALVATVEGMLVDVAVQLVIGALQRLAATSGSVTAVAAIRNPELLEACIAISERWVQQLYENIVSCRRSSTSTSSTSSGGGARSSTERQEGADNESQGGNGFQQSRLLSQSGTGGFLKKPRAPGRTVLAVGDSTWELIFGGTTGVSRDTVGGLVAAILGTGQESAAPGEAASEPSRATTPPQQRLQERLTTVLGRLAVLDVHFHLGAAEGGVWIVKPSGLSCGVGIRCLRSLGEIAGACAELDFKAVVQKYIERPLLVRGRKFDIRLWVLVTSLRPLVVWGFSDCYLRFSTKRFDLSALDDRLVHLCNFSIQKERPDGRESSMREDEATAAEVSAVQEARDAQQVVEEPTIDEDGSMMGARVFAAYIDRVYGPGSWLDLQRDMRRCVMATLEAGRHTMHKIGRGFEWIGFDLMIVERDNFASQTSTSSPAPHHRRLLQALLIEANASPDVSHSTAVTAAIVPLATRDLLRLVLDEGQASPLSEHAKGSLPRPLSAASHRLCPAFFGPDTSIPAAGGPGAAATEATPDFESQLNDWTPTPGFPPLPCWQLWFVEGHESCPAACYNNDGAASELLLLQLAEKQQRGCSGTAARGGRQTHRRTPPGSMKDLIHWVPQLGRSALPKPTKPAELPEPRPEPPTAPSCKTEVTTAAAARMPLDILESQSPTTAVSREAAGHTPQHDGDVKVKGKNNDNDESSSEDEI